MRWTREIGTLTTSLLQQGTLTTSLLQQGGGQLGGAPSACMGGGATGIDALRGKGIIRAVHSTATGERSHSTKSSSQQAQWSENAPKRNTREILQPMGHGNRFSCGERERERETNRGHYIPSYTHYVVPSENTILPINKMVDNNATDQDRIRRGRPGAFQQSVKPSTILIPGSAINRRDAVSSANLLP